MSHAVIRAGGKQFIAEEGRTLRVPFVAAKPGESIEFDALLTIAGGSARLEKTRVSATVLEHGRGAKLIVFKKKRRKHYKRTRGHRQGFTTIKVDSIK